MNIIKKLLNIPAGEKQVEAVELYEVRWTSRQGEYSSSVKPEVEMLTSLEAAQEFKAALENAFRLLRHTGLGTSVQMRKRD